MDTKMFRHKKEIVGACANWIVRQSPVLPSNLVEIINYVNDYVQDYRPQDEVLEFNDEQELRSFIELMCKGSDKIMDLNKSQAEKEGKPVPDIMFVSRYDVPKPEYDFVDIDALIMNIVRQIKLDE